MDNQDRKTDRTFWTQDEEQLLAKCFIKISEDPKNGNDQARDTFWYKILDVYNERAEENGWKVRNKNMLTGKWTPMNRDVQKFNSIYDQTKLLSGENEDDLFTRLLIFFKDQTGKEFTLRSAWLFLKNKFKWKNPESTQARRSRGRVTEEEVPEMFGEDAIPRPPGAHRKQKFNVLQARRPPLSVHKKSNLLS
nr:hypothetical protein [Tanacetum cinerariifolium]